MATQHVIAALATLCALLLAIPSSAYPSDWTRKAGTDCNLHPSTRGISKHLSFAADKCGFGSQRKKHRKSYILLIFRHLPFYSSGAFTVAIDGAMSTAACPGEMHSVQVKSG